MDKPVFLIAKVHPGDLNAMVKNSMAQMPDTDDPNEVVRRINSGEWVVRKADLLKQVTTVSVDGVKRFCAKDSLKEANVGWTSDNFDKLFLNKTEEGVPAATIAVHNLERDSLDAPIMSELGDRTEIQLVHFFDLLKRQSKGEESCLLINGRANIAYIRGTDGNFWAVNAFWNSVNGFWCVDACSVANPGGWDAGGRVLSCDS